MLFFLPYKFSCIVLGITFYWELRWEVGGRLLEVWREERLLLFFEVWREERLLLFFAGPVNHMQVSGQTCIITLCLTCHDSVEC